MLWKISTLVLSIFGLLAALFSAHDWVSLAGAILSVISAGLVLVDAKGRSFLLAIASIAVSVIQGAQDLKKVDAPYMAAAMGKSAMEFSNPEKYNLEQEDLIRLFNNCSPGMAGLYFIQAIENVVAQIFDKTGLAGNFTDPGEPPCTVVSKEIEMKSPQFMKELRESEL